MRKTAAVLIALAAIAEIGAEAIVRARVPEGGDWRAAARFVRERQRDGDGIVFAPRWADPIGRLHFGDLVPVEEAARPDRSRQARIWEVSIRGATHSEAARPGRATEERRFGRVRVRLIERRAARVLYDVTAGAAGAKVAEVDFQPVRCVPLPPGRTLALPDVPLGRTLAVSTGIDDFQSRYESSAPVTLDVLIGGERIARIRHESDDGWTRTAIDTTRLEGTRAALRFEATADRPKRRTLCFHAEVHE